MNKLPAKQIYLLTIIIVGIIALSVYSTYALFTFESQTSDIVSIHTPKSLQISESIYEYQQLTLEPNSTSTTDIYIYNSFDYDVCYSIWYKIVGDTEIENKVQIFEKSNNNITSSGTLPQSENIKINIVLINDNDSKVKINIGTIGEKLVSGSCSLNLPSDKKIISTSYSNIESLNDKLLKLKDEIKEEKSFYLTYKNENKTITYRDTDKIYISEKFNYNNELFTLENPEELTIKEIIDNKYLENKNIYFCQDEISCSILYKITKIEQQEQTEDDSNIYYNINLYDKLVGYSEGKSGLRQTNSQDYFFYGDNPNNFIYYNCKDINDKSTCELWRIIGLFYNQETEEYNVKIIKNDSIGKYQFDNSNKKQLLWVNSTLHKYLNEEFKFVSNYENYINKYKQNIETLSSLDTTIKKQEQTIDSKVNVLSLSDYLNTSSCQKNKVNEYTDICLKNNWLNNIELEKVWTLTTKEQLEEIKEELEDKEQEEPPIENKVLNSYAYSIGNQIIETNANDYLDVRPVVYLKSRMITIDGSGTIDSPYLIR